MIPLVNCSPIFMIKACLVLPAMSVKQSIGKKCVLREANSNKRLERTRHEPTTSVGCVGEPLKRNVRCFALMMVINYNGTGTWGVDEVLKRYALYARKYGIATPRD